MENQKDRPSREKRSRRPRRSGGRNGRQQQNQRSPKVENLIRRIKGELADSIEPIIIPELNAFERKLVHRQFDNNPEIVTKTYRLGDDEFELRVYPVGNLKRYAQKKADEAVETRQKVELPHMSNYERFVVHDYLKTLDTVKTTSVGEEDDRHVEIEPEIFGRGLKRIIKKIKLF